VLLCPHKGSDRRRLYFFFFFTTKSYLTETELEILILGIFCKELAKDVQINLATSTAILCYPFNNGMTVEKKNTTEGVH